MKIGIIVAMTSELDCVRSLIRNAREEKSNQATFYVGSDGKHEIILTQSGIGKVNAALRTQTLILNYTPDCIINTGVAGGIDMSTRMFDIVIGRETVYHDVWLGDGNVIGQIEGLPPRFPADNVLLQKVEQSKRTFPKVWPKIWNRRQSPKLAISMICLSSVPAS